MFVIFRYRFFLIAKLYYAYAIFVTFLLQFYVPMDFLEPPLNRAINRMKKWLCVQKLEYRSPDHYKILNTALLLVFRTVIVLVIGMLIMTCDLEKGPLSQ